MTPAWATCSTILHSIFSRKDAMNRQENDFDIFAIKEHLNKVHKRIDPDPDVFISDVHPLEEPYRGKGRIECYAECQHCMKSGFTTINDDPKFHIVRGKPKPKPRIRTQTNER